MPSTFFIRNGTQNMETYGFRCAYCGKPLDVKYGNTKALIVFSRVKCENCGQVLKTTKDIEYEPEED